MDFNATIDLIIKDLDEARDIIDDLKKYPGVPALQVELAKSKCKSAGEVIALLKSLSDYIPLVKEVPVQSLQEQHLQEEKMKPAVSVKINPGTEEKKSENIPVEITPPPVVKKEQPEKIQKKVSESTIIADKFSQLTNTFNEKLGSMMTDNEVSDILKSKPITSLSEAIGVNDQFLFIREIFNGNKDTYIQAISRLDNADSLTDARAVIMSYKGDSDENEAVKQLLDLVKRKLPSDE
jgi:hypothetical protein